MTVREMIDRMVLAMPEWAPLGCDAPPEPDPEVLVQYAPRRPTPTRRVSQDPVVIPIPLRCNACGCITMYDDVCMSPYCRLGWERG